MILALEKNSSMINDALKTAQIDYSKSIKQIQEYLDNEGIKETAIKEIDTLLVLADEKLRSLPIDKRKLLYFSESIKRRGH